ncbi:MAG: hypothetical protein J0I07_03545 [Myxococcales bacterium]|nr:hypothetical protein [Myxococcales bacterium]
MIASASDIRSAIRVYYGEPTGSAPVLEVPVAQARAAPPVSARDAAPVTPPIATQPDPPRSSPAAARRTTPSVPPPTPDEAPPSTTRSSPPSTVTAAGEEGVRKAPPARAEEAEPGRRKPRMVNLTLLDGTTISLQGTCEGTTVRLQVQDEGPGIPQAELERIFDKFYRVRKADSQRAGTGLGLAICRGFVEAMGGTIEASNRASGHGAVFTVVLPVPNSNEPRAMP